MIGSLLNFSGPDLLIILLIIVLLFGATRIPALAKGIRQAIAAFKEGKGEADSKDRSAIDPKPPDRSDQNTH
jgi:sec-independent protein translocase protein TatA